MLSNKKTEETVAGLPKESGIQDPKWDRIRNEKLRTKICDVVERRECLKWK